MASPDPEHSEQHSAVPYLRQPSSQVPGLPDLPVLAACGAFALSFPGVALAQGRVHVAPHNTPLSPAPRPPSHNDVNVAGHHERIAIYRALGARMTANLGHMHSPKPSPSLLLIQKELAQPDETPSWRTTPPYNQLAAALPFEKVAVITDKERNLARLARQS